MTTKDLTIIQKSLSPLAAEAKTLKIKDLGSLKMATEILSKLNKLNDRIREEKERVTKPLNEALKAECSRWKPMEMIYEESIAVLRTAMSDYQTEQLRIQKEEEDRIAKRIAPGKGNLSLDSAVKKMEAIPQTEKEISTEEGLVQFRQVRVLKITNIDLVPHEYFDLNEGRLLTDLKTGKTIAGAEIEVKQVPANYR